MRNKKPTRTRENLPNYRPPIISIGKSKFNVLTKLNEGGNPHSISKYLHLSRSTIIQHLQELKDKGFTKKDAFGDIWLITKQGKEFLEGRFSKVAYERDREGLTGKWLKDRPHNIKIKFEVQESDIQWESLGWKPNKIKNNIFYLHRFGEIVTTFTGKSLIFQLPIMRFESPELAVAEAGRIAMSLKDKYEREIKGLSLGKYKINAQLISQHHAIQNDPYSKWLTDQGITYSDELIDIDKSSKCSNCGEKVPEIEFTDNEKSHIHAQKYIDHQKDIIINEVPKISEIMSLIKEVTNKLNEQAELNKETSAGLLSLTKFLEHQYKTPNYQPQLNIKPDYIN